jgi:hypothetical protein
MLQLQQACAKTVCDPFGQIQKLKHCAARMKKIDAIIQFAAESFPATVDNSIGHA